MNQRLKAIAMVSVIATSGLLIMQGTTLPFSTFLGGSGADAPHEIAIGVGGDIFITGDTSSLDFPISPSDVGNGSSGVSCFLSRLSADGTVLKYTVFFGGSGTEAARDIAIDQNGNVHICGTTQSNDFPTTPGAFQTNYQGGASDGFLIGFSPDGNMLYSSYLGGSGSDEAWAIKTGSQGDLFLTGNTRSPDFPIAGLAVQGTYGGDGDSFVIRLNSTANAPIYSTYFGGSGGEGGSDLAVTTSGKVVVLGGSASSDLITVNPIQNQYAGGGMDGLIFQLNETGSVVEFSTFLGGSGFDAATSLVLDVDGNIVFGGDTQSGNFPVLNAVQSTHGGGTDLFLGRIQAQTFLLDFATYYGVSGNFDGTENIFTDSLGRVIAVGRSTSSSFPVVSPIQAFGGGTIDGILVVLSPDGSQVDFSTFIGGNQGETIRSVVLDQEGNIVIAGVTQSTDFPLSNPLQPVYGGDNGAPDVLFGGGGDVFVTKLSDFPGQAVLDSDGDGILDVDDNCPQTFNPTQDDFDGDGIGDLCDPDIDGDGLDNDDEGLAGTDIYNPDTDSDGLLDGEEVTLAAGSGCPSPLEPDSDFDLLTDSEELVLGTLMCNPDTDGDGVIDGEDPTPNTPGVTPEYISDDLQLIASEILTFSPNLFEANNSNAASGKAGALANKVLEAQAAVDAGDLDGATDILTNVLKFVDGQPKPKDWLKSSPEQEALKLEIELLIALILLL